MRRSRAGRAVAARQSRWWRPDRNPLRRTVDRVEIALITVLCAAFFICAPWAAMTAGRHAASAALRLERAQAGWRQVPAKLIKTSPGWARARAETSLEPMVPAWWTAPDGAVRTGDVYAPAAAVGVGTVLVWVDQHGRLTGAPLSPVDVVDRVALAAMLACLAVAGLIAGVGSAVRLLANRRRLAGWEVGWSVAGPQWSGRR